jgi:hypothetical protein
VLERARAIYDVPIEPAMPALAEVLGDPRMTNAHVVQRAVNAHYRLGQPRMRACPGGIRGKSQRA